MGDISREQRRVHHLRAEHAALEHAIVEAVRRHRPDEEVRRLKARRLAVKDMLHGLAPMPRPAAAPLH